MSNKLIIMCGVSGSGKSTYVLDHYKPENGDIWISRDKIRFALLSDTENYFSQEKEVWKKFVRDIAAGLHDGHTVYADQTSLNKKSRQKLLNAVAAHADYIKIVAIETPKDICIDRDSKRTGRSHVSKDVILNQLDRYERPGLNEDSRINEVYIYVDGYNHD